MEGIKFSGRRSSSRFVFIAVAVLTLGILPTLPADAQSVVVGRNANAVGPFADGFYSGKPHYQDNEPDCDRNPLMPANIVCMVNGYNGSEDEIGDSWPKILETQDNARTWVSRFASGHAADPATDLGLGFGADPIMVCFPGGCAGFFIASNRTDTGGEGGGVYMELMPELNIETGFRHYSLAAGPRTVQLGTGENFLDKIDALFIPDTQNPGTISITETVSLGGSQTREISRKWPKGRFVVVYASLNSSKQNVRIFSTYSDDYGLNWDPPKQVAQTTGLDTGVAITAIGNEVLYAYRQFQDDSGDQLNAVYAAVSPDGGQRVGKVFPVFESFCPFDQPTLPSEENQSAITPRTNNFVALSNDGEHFVMTLASRLPGPNGCFEPPFDYPAGSRVLVAAAKKQNPRTWSDPVELAPVDPEGPAEGHSYQFMPAVNCVLGVCQSIWYDSFRDSARNIAWLASFGAPADVAAFKAFPFFGDFLYELEGGDIVQFRRTADIYGRQFEVAGGSPPQVVFRDVEPVRITSFQTWRAPKVNQRDPDVLFEVEQLPATLKQYGGNTVPFLGDYLVLASQGLRIRSDSVGPDGEPHYESNAGMDLANPNLRAKWWAAWTDTRNAAGQLYTDSLTEALPFANTPMSTATAKTGDEAEVQTEIEKESKLLSERKKLGAEGVEDNGTVAATCVPQDPLPGQKLFLESNKNRIKDADIYGALIEQPATAWVLNASKGFGPDRPQRAFVIAARNESETESRTFRFEIVNQPVGFEQNKARASWLQLPFENFDNEANPPDPTPPNDETVGPQSSVTVALFIVSATPVNPVKVNVYDVITNDANPPEETLELVETLIVNGEIEAGPLITPFGAIDVNQSEIHNPFVYDPFTANPAIWNPAIWNPAIWNPAIWNPAIWNPAIWNPAIWNPAIWNPAIWNPAIWNPAPVGGSTSALSTTSSTSEWDQDVIDANNLDNPEIPAPDLSDLVNPDKPFVAKIDVQFAAENQGNTLTPYVADFAVNSPIVRDLLANNELATQLIVWEDARTTSFQGCTPDEINGQNRVLAVANNPDLTNLKLPDIVNNRFGSITYYLEPGDQIYLTLRFIGSEAAVRKAADALFTLDGGGISYVITSQAANTGSQTLRTICTGTSTDEICDQAIKDLVPPTLTLSADPVVLPAVRDPAANDPASADIGTILPAGLVTATGSEFEGALTAICSSDALASDVVFDPDAPADQFVKLPLATTQFSCSATRNAGTTNEVTASITFDVTVEDQEPPVFDVSTLPTDFTLERELLNGTNLTLTMQPAADVWDGPEDLPVATDNIDTNVTVSCNPLAPGGLAPFSAPGATRTEIICTATDDTGKTAEASFEITVRDITPPKIDPISNIWAEAQSPDGAEITILPPTVTEAGNLETLDCKATIDGNRLTVIGTNQFPIGQTVVNCDAQDDAGNVATTVLFTVAVEDNVPPVITEVQDFVGENAVEANTTGGAILSFTEPTATDFDGTVVLEVTCDKSPAGDLYRLYEADGGPTTTVTCSATDGFNTAQETFDVTVVDTTPPELTVPGDIKVVLEGANGTVVDFQVTATDIADANPTVTCAPASGSLFPQGTTMVDCEAVDASGKSVADTFSVTVELGVGSGLSASKNAIKAGSVLPLTWAWTDSFGNPVDIGNGNQDIEARLKVDRCPSSSSDVLDEDPGSSGFQKLADNSWQYNWQTVTIDELGNKVSIEPGNYCVEVILVTTGQRQSTEIKVTP